MVESWFELWQRRVTSGSGRLAKEAERDRQHAEMRKLRDQRRLEQELEQKNRPRKRRPAKAKKKSNKEKTPTALAPWETVPDPSSNTPAPVEPGAEFCNSCNQRVNVDGSCGCGR